MVIGATETHFRESLPSEMRTRREIITFIESVNKSDDELTDGGQALKYKLLDLVE